MPDARYTEGQTNESDGIGCCGCLFVLIVVAISSIIVLAVLKTLWMMV